MEPSQSRRDLLLAPLLMALPILAPPAFASPLNLAQTIIKLRDELSWTSDPSVPKQSSDSCLLFGNTNASGLYYTLIRWYPGYMSAPHLYSTDRLCVVVSGTWWCNSGADFDPPSCVPVEAGSFVHRIAGTPHYDGVPRGHSEVAVIAICGMGPINLKLVDPSKPLVRAV